MADMKMVLVPRELLELLYEKTLGLEDCGPMGEGWKSDELEEAVGVLGKLLAETKEPGAA